MDLKPFKEWLAGIDPAFLAKVKKVYPEINRLLYFCAKTGKIEKIGAGNKYKILQPCPELTKLKKLLADLKIGGIQFIE
jgi:hypothetical protein